MSIEQKLRDAQRGDGGALLTSYETEIVLRCVDVLRHVAEGTISNPKGAALDVLRQVSK